MKDFLIQNAIGIILGLFTLGGIIWAWFKAIQKNKSDLKIARIKKDEVVANLTAIFFKQNPDILKNEKIGEFLEQNSEVQKIKAEIEHLESIGKVLNFWKTNR